MKKLLFLLMIFSQAMAQDTLQVTEFQRQCSRGMQNCYSIYIPQVNLKDVSANWKKYQREKNKSNYHEVNGEFILSKTIIPEISSDSIIVLSILSAATSHVNLSAFVCSSDSSFYSSTSNPSVSGKITTYVRKFALNEYMNAVAHELVLEQKKLKVIEEELAILEKDNEKMEKKISTNDRELEKIDINIKSNMNEQDLNAKSIYHQQEIISRLDKSDLRSDEEKKLKELEKSKKKLQKEKDSFLDDIDDLRSENKTLKKKIEDNTDEFIPAKKKEKDNQRLVIANVEVKLKGIQ